MGRFGEHSAAVEEVIAFANSPKLLAGRHATGDFEDIYLISDLRLAVELETAEENRRVKRVSWPDRKVNPELMKLRYCRDLSAPNESYVYPDEDACEFGWYGQLCDDLHNHLRSDLMGLPSEVKKPLVAEFLESTSLLDDLVRRFDKENLAAGLGLAGRSDALHVMAQRVHADFYDIACACASGGRSTLFMKKYELYRRGFWPCGWRWMNPAPGKPIAWVRS